MDRDIRRVVSKWKQGNLFHHEEHEAVEKDTHRSVISLLGDFQDLSK